MQRVQDQRQMPVLLKSSFTEALLVVLKCTDAVNHSGVWAKERLHCLARPGTRLPA